MMTNRKISTALASFFFVFLCPLFAFLLVQTASASSGGLAEYVGIWKKVPGGPDLWRQFEVMKNALDIDSGTMHVTNYKWEKDTVSFGNNVLQARITFETKDLATVFVDFMGSKKVMVEYARVPTPQEKRKRLEAEREMKFQRLAKRIYGFLYKGPAQATKKDRTEISLSIEDCVLRNRIFRRMEFPQGGDKFLVQTRTDLASLPLSQVGKAKMNVEKYPGSENNLQLILQFDGDKPVRIDTAVAESMVEGGTETKKAPLEQTAHYDYFRFILKSGASRQDAQTVEDCLKELFAICNL